MRTGGADLQVCGRRQIVGGAGRQPLAQGFGQTARRVDQRRARLHQRRADPDHHQVLLRFLAAMVDRMQQLRIGARQPRQHPRVQPASLCGCCG